MGAKNVLIKPLKLQKCFNDFLAGGDRNKDAREKFERVWGKSMADHFLSKYSDAESLIWAFDSDNLQLFIDKF